MKHITFYIVAIGPTASGKTKIIENFKKTLPQGYQVKQSFQHCTGISNEEVWTIVVGTDNAQTS